MSACGFDSSAAVGPGTAALVCQECSSAAQHGQVGGGLWAVGGGLWAVGAAAARTRTDASILLDGGLRPTGVNDATRLSEQCPELLAEVRSDGADKECGPFHPLVEERRKHADRGGASAIAVARFLGGSGCGCEKGGEEAGRRGEEAG